MPRNDDDDVPGVVGARSSDEHERRAARHGASTAALATMIITRGTATTVAARWALLLKRETLGRTYHNGGQRQSAVTRSDLATAMLPLCGRTHAVHGNDSSSSNKGKVDSSFINNNNNNTITFVGTGPQWTINSSGCTVALALSYYYCQRRVGDITVTSNHTLLVDDHEDDPIARASPSQQQQDDDDDEEDEDEDANEAAVVNGGDGRLLNRWDRLRCCA